MVTYRFGSPEHHRLLRRSLNFIPAEDRQRAFRAGAKKIARHFGTYSKYDGAGNRREGFPKLVQDASPIVNPNSRNYIK